MKKAFEKNKILIPISAVGVIILNMIFWNIFNKLVIPAGWFSDTKLSTIVNTVENLAASAVFIIIIKKLFGMKIGIGKKELAKGIFLYGLVVCITAVTQFILSFQTPEKSLGQALPWILLFFIYNMTVGMIEEIIYRGLIFNSFRKYFGESKNDIYKAVLMSGAVFGAVHITNLIFAPALFIATITQVIYAFFFGVLFAVIYYRTGNLLPCIILHGIIDLSAAFWTCFANDIDKQINTANTTDIDIGTALMILGTLSTLFISGLWQLRRSFKTQQTAAPKERYAF